MATVSNLVVGHQNGTDRTIYATWKWTKTNTDYYVAVWQYATGDGVWFDGSTTNVTTKQSTYTAPSNAKKVRFRVKPVSKRNPKDKPYWTADYCSYKGYVFTITAPKVAGKPYNVNVELQNGTDNTLFVTWDWKMDNVEHYRVVWQYGTGDGVWFTGSDSTVTIKRALYTLPSNAINVRVKVLPVSKTRTIYGKEVAYWTASWSTYERYSVKDLLEPEVAPVPTVTIDKYRLTAEVDTYDTVANFIEFQVIKDDIKKYATSASKVIKNHATCIVDKITPGSEYKVRARGIKVTLKPGYATANGLGNLPTLVNASSKYVNKVYGDWSEYSANVSTIPSAPTKLNGVAALSESSVKLSWSAIKTAKSYDVEYTTDKSYFDKSSEVQTQSVTGVVEMIITGLESGEEWFFRVRAVNDAGESGWSAISSIKIGKKPSAPTTWSERSTAVVGETVNLYWVHNSEDGSLLTTSQLELTVNGSVKPIVTINNTSTEEDITSKYALNTSSYPSGALVKWRVRTKGIIATYSDWSISRSIRVDAPATLSFTTPIDDILTSFPLEFSLQSGPTTQTPTGYYVSITPTEQYETTDNTGKRVFVNSGDVIFSRHYNSSAHTLNVSLTPSDVNLENNVTYMLTCMVSMNTGLTATKTEEFTVAWGEDVLYPDLIIGYDDGTYSTFLQPYCNDADGNPIENISLSIYRRDFDGSFTEIATGISNTNRVYVTDPHPSLDFARYRVVAISQNTGVVSYYDPPGFPIGEDGVIIQWSEDWINLEESEEVQDQRSWSGSLVRLPYNINVSETNSVDVSLVEYIGRRHPVSYYGTQVGQSATWTVIILKEDSETLFALRRLQVWMGDVYVREPSGSGYWAQIKVSFSQTHNELTVPVTLDITRVEGGV